ncbi:MAG: IS1096 element passenger TnpR family protein [Egibacteraceae bacterium]
MDPQAGALRATDLPERFHRRLLDGGRAFPPEDCGGLWGYEKCVRVACGGEDPEGRREWLGDDWDPEVFDLESTQLYCDC